MTVDMSTMIGLVTVAYAAGFVVGRFAFGERIETLKSRLEARDEKLADCQARLDRLDRRQPRLRL